MRSAFCAWTLLLESAINSHWFFGLTIKRFIFFGVFCAGSHLDVFGQDKFTASKEQPLCNNKSTNVQSIADQEPKTYDYVSILDQKMLDELRDAVEQQVLVVTRPVLCHAAHCLTSKLALFLNFSYIESGHNMAHLRHTLERLWLCNQTQARLQKWSLNHHGGDISSSLVREAPPPPIPALWAHLVAKGQ